MKVAIIAASLNSKSNSRALAGHLKKKLESASTDVDFIDLRDHALPICDGGQSAMYPDVVELANRLFSADAIVIASPIYNYDVNAAVKNLVELTGGKAWSEKIVGFICAAGSGGSYMSVMPFANSLMLDFRCLIIPRFIYTTDDLDQTSDQLPSDLNNRVGELSRSLIKYGSV